MTTRTFAAIVLAASLCATAAVAGEASGSDDSFWSRVTVALPVYTHHFPHDDEFNDHNWGVFVDVRLLKNFSVDAGDFTNSYRRNTAFVAAAYTPINLRTEHFKVDVGGMLGVDLNGGYRPFNEADPFLGAVIVRFGGRNFKDPDLALLNRIGVSTTIIPAASRGGSTAVNFAISYRIP